MPALLEPHGTVLGEKPIHVHRFDPTPEPIGCLEQAHLVASISLGQTPSAVKAGDPGTYHDRIKFLQAHFSPLHIKEGGRRGHLPPRRCHAAACHEEAML